MNAQLVFLIVVASFLAAITWLLTIRYWLQYRLEIDLRNRIDEHMKGPQHPQAKPPMMSQAAMESIRRHGYPKTKPEEAPPPKVGQG